MSNTIRALEQALIKYRLQLEESQLQNEELRQAHVIQSEFLSNVSHELRTPLTSIQAYCELLLMFSVEDPSTREEFLHHIEHECQRLIGLVDDILDASKLTANKIVWNIRPGDLLTVIRRTMKRMTRFAVEKGLSLESELPDYLPAVEMDEERIGQVVANLINNAIKFTEKGSVRVSATTKANSVQVSVEDTGCGIAPADQRRIFEKFQQIGDILTEKPTGTGLGLYVSREILHRHGGSIHVESKLRVGSKFTFCLPV